MVCEGKSGYCSENGGNVLYCSMGSEHYVSHAGIGFGGFIYIMFYCSILLLKHTSLELGKASALCEGGLSKGKKYLAFVVLRNNRTIPQKTPKNLIKSRAWECSWARNITEQ